VFRALLAHPQEVLHKRHLVYCVRVMSVGCYQDWSGTGVEDTTPTQILFYVQCRLTRSFRAVAVACHIVSNNNFDFGGRANSRMSAAEFNAAVYAIMIPFLETNIRSMFLATLY
jgi:hypothetical protein